MRNYFTSGVEYNWHEDNEWVFTGSGCCWDGYAIMILHLDSPAGRELTVCGYLRTCAGFVPDRVLPYLSSGQDTSVTVAPIYSLVHDYFVADVAWNDSGTLLATFSDKNTYEEDFEEESLISIWDMTDEEPSLQQEITLDRECRRHPLGCLFSWHDEDTLLMSRTIEIDSATRHFIEFFNINTLEIWREEVSNDLFYDQNPNFEIVLTEDDEPLAYLVNMDTQERVSDNPLQNYPYFNNSIVDYNAHNDLLVWGTRNHTIGGRVWYVPSGELLGITSWIESDKELSPDNTLLAVASQGQVTIWDMTPYLEAIVDNN